MQKDGIRRLLPSVMQSMMRRGDPMDAVLDVMEELHAPDVEILEGFENLLDPFTAPDRLLPFLSAWVDQDWLHEDWADGAVPPLPVCQRRLIAAAPSLARQRGTARGLKRFLEIATGTTGFSVTEDPEKPFHVVVTAPASARSHQALVGRCVRVLRPAHATVEVSWDSADEAAPHAPEEDRDGDLRD